MAIFKKKSKQPLEPELAALRQRADALEAKRRASDVELSVATEARQRHLVEGDLDDVKKAQTLQDAVNVAASKVVGLEDAIAVVEGQIADIERQLDAERTHAERAAAADKLASDLDAIESVLPRFLAQSLALADALSSVAHWHFESAQMAQFTSDCATQIEVAAAFSVTELKGLVNAIREGQFAVPPKPAQPAPVIAPEPAPETRRVSSDPVFTVIDRGGPIAGTISIAKAV